MTTIEKLIEIAKEVGGEGMERLHAPDWGAGRWEWEFYASDELRDLWGDLPSEAKLIEYIHAKRQAQLDDPDSAAFC